MNFMRYINTGNGNNQSTFTTIQGIPNNTDVAIPIQVNFRVNPSNHLVMTYYINNTESVKKIIFNWEKFVSSVFGC